MLLNKKEIFGSYIFICTILFIGINAFENLTVSNVNGVVLFTFIFNGVIIFLRLLKNSKLGYSLSSVIDMFMFVFMFLAPMIQYLNKIFPWGNAYLISDKIIVVTNFIILLFLLIYYLFYGKFILKYKKNKKNFTLVSFINIQLILDIGFVISILGGIYIISITGIQNLFARSTNSLGLDNTQGLIVNNFLKGFPTTTLLMNLVYWKKNRRFHNLFQVLTLSLLTVLLNFPTGTARFQVAVVYLALLIVTKQKFNNKYLFKYVLFIGLFVIFPLLNVFRRNTFADLATLNITLPNPIDSFLTGNYDTYSMLARSIIYVSTNGTTLGSQLLGNVFFFIPRSLWPDKPIGSGVFIGEYFGWEFTNVSMPYIGEGYINFGLFGIVLFSVFLAFITSKLDYNYEEMVGQSYKKVSLISIVYPMLIGYLFFIMRGDLLSSLSYTLGYGIMPSLTLFVLDRLLFSIKKNI